MLSILLVEQSATLRHLAVKLLRQNGYNVHEFDDYSAALEALQDERFSDDLYGVMLGWSQHKSDHGFSPLLGLLNGDAFRDLSVMVMGLEASENSIEWVNNRPNTALLMWEDYREAASTLKLLLQKKTESSRTDAIPRENVDDIRILFVDDSATVRLSYRKLLTSHGYKTDVAVDIADGLRHIARNTYEIVIVDYFLPDGTGDMLCRHIRDNPDTGNIVTAIITGTYIDKAIIESLEAGAVECMFKNEANELFISRIDAMSRSIRDRHEVVKDRQRLDGILASVGDGVYGVDNNGLITFINPAAKRILGYKATDNLLGKSPYDLFQCKTETREFCSEDECSLCKTYGNSARSEAMELLFRKKSGKEVAVECTVYPLHIENVQEGSVIAFRDITERKFLEDELKWQATHDSLTKLHNRLYFEDYLAQEVNRAKRSKSKSALLYFDLDRFKYLNDTAGHEAGDALLVEVANKLQERVRKSDMLARIGGDEFAIVVRDINVDECRETGDAFRDLLNNYRFVYAGKTYTIHSSIGIAVIDESTRSAGEVLANADIACYVAKNAGRNTCHVFDSTHDHKSAMDMELGWSTRLQDALENDRFVLHFQPIMPVSGIAYNDLEDSDKPVWGEYLQQAGQETLYYEALLRLVNKNGELVAPNAFLPTAERFNLMYDIDRWVIRNAVRAIADSDSSLDVHLSVNISGQTLTEKDLVAYVHQQCEKYDVRPSCLTFEVTESTAIANMEKAIEMIKGLRDLGSSFALDDFGSGYCSLSHLKYLPVDYIKIDGIFVKGLLNDKIDMAIVNAVVEIAHSAGRFTVAEYVDNPEVLKVLAESGVDFMQGFYISEPLRQLDQNRAGSQQKVSAGD